MVDGFDFEGALLARLGLDTEAVSHVVYDLVEDPDTGEYAEAYFCWAGCDCCNYDGATRGGSVYDVDVVAFGAGTEIIGQTLAQVCGECLCGLINGDWSGHE
jgi:hypothetical protein